MDGKCKNAATRTSAIRPALQSFFLCIIHSLRNACLAVLFGVAICVIICNCVVLVKCALGLSEWYRVLRLGFHRNGQEICRQLQPNAAWQQQHAVLRLRLMVPNMIKVPSVCNRYIRSQSVFIRMVESSFIKRHYQLNIKSQYILRSAKETQRRISSGVKKLAQMHLTHVIFHTKDQHLLCSFTAEVTFVSD